MSQPTKERILEFQKIIKEEYNKKVSYEKSAEILRNLIGYFDLLAKICHKDKNSK